MTGSLYLSPRRRPGGGGGGGEEGGEGERGGGRIEEGKKEEDEEERQRLTSELQEIERERLNLSNRVNHWTKLTAIILIA